MRLSRPATALLGILALAMTLLPAQNGPVRTPVRRPPAFDHIFVVLEENEDFAEIVDNPRAPFINELIRRNFLERHYMALDHGSLPDYLGLVSGSEQKQVIGDPPGDCLPDWMARPPSCAISGGSPSNLADTIEAAGKTWRGYFQSMGAPCRWQSKSALYDVIHNPFVYFASVEGGAARSSARCVGDDVDMFQDSQHPLAIDLRQAATTPNFLFMVPNNVYSMHNGSITAGDSFLRDILTGVNSTGQNSAGVNLFASPAWMSARSILYVVWDENSGTQGNQVPAIEVGNWVNGPAGGSDVFADHYSLLRTWEAAWGLAPIQRGSGDDTARPMLAAFGLVDGLPSTGRLPRPHLEIFAQARARVRSRDGPVSVFALTDGQGQEILRLGVDRAGLLRLVNGVTGLSTTSRQPFGSGWHTVGLHVFTQGSLGSCEVWYDGVPVSELTDVGHCSTGTDPIAGYAGASVAVDISGVALGTGPL